MSSLSEVNVENLNENNDNSNNVQETCETNLKSEDYYKNKYQKLNEEKIKFYDEDGKPLLFNGVEVSKLTKSQLKKYRRTLKFEAVKKERRSQERLKAKRKKQEAKLYNIDLGPSRKQLKRSTMANSACKTSIVIDLSFDDLMIPKDIGKVIKQVLRCYTENRRSVAPMQLHLTSFEGKSRNEMQKHDGYEHWDLNFHEKPYLDIFPKEKLVYLSSESENVINTLDEDKVYIIGGLVDHNSHKGICYKKAVEQGIQHGQLPISEYFFTKHRKVFTINQVFEILLRVTEGKSFKAAFESSLPKRINIQPNENKLVGITKSTGNVNESPEDDDDGTSGSDNSADETTKIV